MRRLKHCCFHPKKGIVLGQKVSFSLFCEITGTFEVHDSSTLGTNFKDACSETVKENPRTTFEID